MPYYLLYIFIAAFGAMLGSFAAVIIYRSPLGISIIWPRSFCAFCENKLKPWHNIPIISWMALGGKCSFCKSHIGLRTIFIEILFSLLAIVIINKYGINLVSIDKFIFCFLLICIAYIDMDYFFIPVFLLVLLTFFGFCSLIFYHFYPHYWHNLAANWQFLPDILQNKNFCIIDHILAAFLGGAFFSLLNILATILLRKTGRLSSKQWAMGWGDPWLVFALGLFLGIKALVLVIFLGSFLGSFIGILQKFFGKKIELDEDIAINSLPYGPFLAIAAIFIYLG